MIGIERVPTKKRLVNGKTSGRARAATRNPGGVLTLGIINPEHPNKRRNSVANKAKSKKKPRAHNPMAIAKVAKAKPRQQNAVVPASPKKKKKAKRNPEYVDMVKTMVKDGAFALGGAVVTRQLPQLVLKANNAGWKGYGANAVAGIVTALATAHFAGQKAGADVLIGAGIYILNRIATEQFSPVGKWVALSGLSNGDAAATGVMGAIRPAFAPNVLTVDKTGKITAAPALRTYVDARVAAAAPATGATASRLNGLSRRMAPVLGVRSAA